MCVLHTHTHIEEVEGDRRKALVISGPSGVGKGSIIALLLIQLGTVSFVGLFCRDICLSFPQKRPTKRPAYKRPTKDAVCIHKKTYKRDLNSWKETCKRGLYMQKARRYRCDLSILNVSQEKRPTQVRKETHTSEKRDLQT